MRMEEIVFLGELTAACWYVRWMQLSIVDGVSVLLGSTDCMYTLFHDFPATILTLQFMPH